MSEVKNIQTKVDKALHARLKHLVEVEGKSIKEVVKRAISEHLQKHEGEVKKEWSERKDWSKGIEHFRKYKGQKNRPN